MRFHPYRTDLNSIPEKGSYQGTYEKRQAVASLPLSWMDCMGYVSMASINRTLADRMPDRDVREVGYHQVQ